MIYLAAPFFNDLEVQTVERIETTMLGCFRTIFSPRWLGTNLNRPANRKTINRANIYYLNQCDTVLAWIDRLMPNDQTIGLLGKSGTVIVRDLGCKPDDGVLFEIGYAVAKDKPVMVFTTLDPKKINVMLLENVKGFIYGWDNLLKVMQGPRNDDMVWNHNLVKQEWEGDEVE